MTNSQKPLTGFAIIGDAVVPVEVVRNRKTDRTAKVRVEGVERGIPKSALFTAEDAANEELARMRDTKEYAERKTEEAKRLEHHAKPPEPLEELDL